MTSTIYVECYVIDLRTNKSAAKYMKTFEMQDDFNKFYTNMKKDITFVMNIFRYNPHENPGQKAVNDATLLRVSRKMPV